MLDFVLSTTYMMHNNIGIINVVICSIEFIFFTMPWKVLFYQNINEKI